MGGSFLGSVPGVPGNEGFLSGGSVSMETTPSEGVMEGGSVVLV